MKFTGQHDKVCMVQFLLYLYAVKGWQFFINLNSFNETTQNHQAGYQ